MPKYVIKCDCDGELKEIARTKMNSGLLLGDSIDATVFFECSNCPKIFMVNIHEDGKIDVDRISTYEGLLTKEQLIEWIPQEKGNYYPKSDDEKIIKKIKEKEEKPLYGYVYCIIGSADKEQIIREISVASDGEARDIAKGDTAGKVAWVAKKI